MTIVFSDLKGSTSLGEALDSEALREVMTRYFDAMRGELERHGGVIEKFIGDAVMAVFGLPRLHEDDALRAVRAASGMQAALEALNDELQLVYGVQLANRTGVNTGEVVAGDPSTGQRLVTGDAVNVAARLEQAAGEREVLLGELTYRLVRDERRRRGGRAARAEGEVRAGAGLPARRACADDRRATDVGEPRRSSAASDELATLERAGRGGRVELLPTRRRWSATPGVGKSRLTAEFLDGIAGRAALATSGRCLPYGEGITFWPLAEAVKAAAGIVNDDYATEVGYREARRTRGPGGRRRDGAPRVRCSACRVEPFPVEELFWAVRRLLSALAAERPVDLRRGGHPLGRADDARADRAPRPGVHDAPVLVLCPTRPELVEESPTGARASGRRARPRAARRRGEPKRMIESLLGGGDARPGRAATASSPRPRETRSSRSSCSRMLVDEGVLERRGRHVAVHRASSPRSTSRPRSRRCSRRDSTRSRPASDR